MTRFRKNVIANAGGQVVNSLIGFLVVPFYQKFLGLEGYALVAFFISLQAVIALLDFGLGTTANREFSRSQGERAANSKMADILRTLECVYGVMALLILCSLSVISGPIAANWFQARELSPEVIQRCVLMAGATVALRWPISLYCGLLRGLEQHVRLNSILTTLAIVKATGGILVIAFVSRTVVAFYQWQLGFSVIETAVMFVAGWHALGLRLVPRARFNIEVLRDLWRFAFKVGWISIFAVALKNLDKIVISKVLPLEQLALYSTASMAGVGLVMLCQPIQIAAFPAMTKLVAQNDFRSLADRFHRSASLISFIVAPAASLMVFFAGDILYWWTHSEVVTTGAQGTLRLIAFAMMVNAMMSVPFVLQIASGMTWLPLVNNAIALGVLGPAIYFLVLKFGIRGGAMAWLIYNLLYYLILPHFVFSHILQGHKLNWYWRDTSCFMLLALGAFGLARLFCSGETHVNARLLAMVGAGIVYMLTAAVTSPVVLDWFQRMPFLRALTRKAQYCLRARSAASLP